MKSKQIIMITCLSTLLILGGVVLIKEAKANIDKASVLNVGVLVYREEDEFISSLTNELEKQIKKTEERYHQKINIKIVDSRNDQSLQNSQVDNFIKNDYDVICVNVVDRTVASMIINRGKQANIPIIFFNREPVADDMDIWDNVYYVGTRAKEAGNMAGELVVDAYQQNQRAIDKNNDGKIQYVLLEGEEDHQDAVLRTEATIASIVNNGVKLEKLDWAIADWMRVKAYYSMEQWLNKYSEAIELVICNNDEMALGAISAMEDKGITDLPFVVGIDGTNKALESIEKDQLSGTVLNDSEAQAEAISQLAYALGNQLKPKEYVPDLQGNYLWVSHKKITKESMRRTNQKKLL